jgi:hypothetical protein
MISVPVLEAELTIKAIFATIKALRIVTPVMSVIALKYTTPRKCPEVERQVILYVVPTAVNFS